MADEDNLVYLLDNKIYINLTNQCTNKCTFCIRTLKDDVCGANLWLKNENISAQDVINKLKKLKKQLLLKLQKQLKLQQLKLLQ